MRLQNLTTLYFQSLRSRNLNENTITSRERNLRKFSKWLTSRNYSVTDILEEDIRDFKRYLESTLKPNTVRTHLSAAKCFYAWLLKETIIFDDPFADFEKFIQIDKLPIVISEETFCELVNRLPEKNKTAKRTKALIELAYSSLLRREELVGLKLSDINLEHRILCVIRKNDKEALIPFGECAKEALLDYLKNERGKLLGEKSSPYLWINRWGRELTYGNMDKVLAAAKKSTGIHFDWHTLRRSGATHMLKNGASLLMIQQMLSHSNLKTLKHYLRLDVTDLKKTHKKAGGLS